MTEAEVFASCLALSHCHFLDTPYEGDPFSDELNSGASNVCHYCTIDTLLSIIENQCLRFTDMRFLNDSTEFLEVIPMIEHVLTNGNYSSSFKQFFLQSSIIEDLKSYVEQWQTMRSENLGLLLWGGVGTGKSFLAGCIANALMEQEVPVRMTSFDRILNELNGSFPGAIILWTSFSAIPCSSLTISAWREVPSTHWNRSTTSWTADTAAGSR